MSAGTLLRQIPGDSPIHRLWAGTKLLGVLILGLTTMAQPMWPVLGAIAMLLVIATALARIGPSAFPRPPWWIWVLFVYGGLLNLVSGLTGLESYLRTTLLGVVLLWASFLVTWTTPAADIAPAVATLMAPLRKLRLPVDEWAVATALCLRVLPTVIDEVRTLWAAHRLRPKIRANTATGDRAVDPVSAVMAVVITRGAQMGDAIAARGGTGTLTARPARFGRTDALALAVVTTACTAGILITHLL